MSNLPPRRTPVIPRPRIRAARSRSELFRRYRKPLALACTLLALAAALNVLATGQLAQRQVVVALADIAAGRTVSAPQIEVQSVPLAPDDRQVITEPAAVLGQRLAVAVPAGTVLREHLLVGPNLLTGSAAGTVAVPIRLSDPATVTLINPGQLVDIVLTTGDGFEQQISSRTIARAVPVLWVPGGDSGGELGMFNAAGTPGEGIIVVAAANASSDELAGAVSRGKVSAVLVN
ncbi:RcpC/CpaB family pilus assembly protein [Glutamicibacter sp. AOP38-B1-38]|uniref:RcpC/CpaB family pilus assembly protein n=1 Tax=Glutamicibacter sp. AOP38-B1-38 TaxID=3457680 RepID=UPI004033DE38